MAVKAGGPDPDSNPRLRIAIQNSKIANMPKANVESAIKRASSKDEKDYEEITYEGYAPHGVALVVDCATDNTTRTVANIRMYFSKMNGSMGTQGSVDYMFKKKATFKFRKDNLNLEELEFELIDAGLIEFQVEDDVVIAYAEFNDFGKLSKAFEEKKIELLESSYEKIPDFYKEGLSDNQAESVIKLIEMLEEDEDVQHVFHNMK